MLLNEIYLRGLKHLKNNNFQKNNKIKTIKFLKEFSIKIKEIYT